MATPKYTPGPWKVQRGTLISGSKLDVAVVAEGKPPRLIADMQSDQWSRKEALADAYLIAAAPDLYESAQRFLGWFKAFMPKAYAEINTPELDMLREALAKATGDI